MKTTVILKKNIKNLGNTSDIVTVKRGYAYNYLIPNNFAILNSTKNLEEFNKIKENILQIEEENNTSVNELCKLLEKIEYIEFIHKTTECGVLYGSIKCKDIINKLSDKISAKFHSIHGIKYNLSVPLIKNTGIHYFKILYGPNVIKVINILVSNNRDNLFLLKEKLGFNDQK